MPELADVEGYRKHLDQHARSHRVVSVEVADRGVLRNTSPQGLSRALRGRRFGEPERLGKYLLAHTDGPTLVLHFGMTGELSWARSSDDRHRHDRVVIGLDEGELRYRDQRKLQGMWLASGEDEARAELDDQGPDAFGISRRQLEERVGARRARLKAALMDQRVIAGLGNLLVDEILWRAHLHPLRATSTLDTAEWDQLHRAMTRVLRDSVRAGRVPTRRSWLTGARDQPEAGCPRCRTRLRRMQVGGRTTAICPRCQRKHRRETEER